MYLVDGEVAVASPDLLVVRHDVYQSYCKVCFQHIKQANTCKDCSKAFYCSSECKESDVDHKISQECSLWKEEPAYPHFSLIQLFRALWRLKTDRGFEEILKALVSYEDSTKASWDEDSEAGLVHWIASIQAYAPNVLSPKYSSNTEIRRVYFAIKLNAFNVKPDEASRAHCSGLYSKLALFNHSCDPNCGIQFLTSENGLPLIRIVALRSILSGEELTISYKNPYIRRSIRRAELKKNFFFDCACNVCSTPFVEKEGSLASELVLFCVDDNNSVQFKLRAFKALILEDLDQASLTEAAVSILNGAMKLRGQNQLDNETSLEILDHFFDSEESSLKYIKTASPDLYWQWIVFLTDASMRSGHSSTKKLAKLGLDTINALYSGSVPASMVPYISWFTAIYQQ